MAQAFRSRPSELLGVSGSFRAFSVDRAVWTFGTAVEGAMDDAEKVLGNKAKPAMITQARQRVWDQFMGINAAEVPGRFRDPATSARRRR